MTRQSDRILIPPSRPTPPTVVADGGAPLVDGHDRTIRYLGVSVTDRCDLRCRYCMAETMTFLPREKLATLDELAIITERFIARGVPLGAVDEDRIDRFLPLTDVQATLTDRFGLTRDPANTGGPARYWRVGGAQRGSASSRR